MLTTEKISRGISSQYFARPGEGSAATNLSFGFPPTSGFCLPSRKATNPKQVWPSPASHKNRSEGRCQCCLWCLNRPGSLTLQSRRGILCVALQMDHYRDAGPPCSHMALRWGPSAPAPRTRSFLLSLLRRQLPPGSVEHEDGNLWKVSP